ncbi:hypothetical protein HDZ31DRAFT_34166 [Schizophyllum fasciatum]
MEILERAASVANIGLHRSSFLPGVEEERAIRGSSQEISSQLSRIDAEILQLSLLRRRLSDQLDLNQSLVAPIRRLPYELLSSIFIHFATDTISGLCEQPRQTTRTVASVCSAWRAVARSTPQLWTRISANAIYPGRPFSGENVYGTQAALTGLLPLQLDHDGRDSAALKRFLDELGPHAPRWQSLALHGSVPIFESLSGYHMPILKEAEFILDGEPTYTVFDFLAGAPALEDLSIVFNYFERELPHELIVPAFPNIAIPTLTHLSLATLVYLDLSMSTDGDWGVIQAGRVKPIDMTALSVLRIGQMGYEICDYIAAPALEEIIVHDVPEAHRSPFPALTDLAPRAQGLRKLALRNVEAEDWEDDPLTPCLEQWKGLQELCVEEPENYAPLLCEYALDGLECVDYRLPVLPNLAAFSLRARPRRPWGRWKEALESVVESRKSARVCQSQPVVALERVQLDVEYV